MQTGPMAQKQVEKFGIKETKEWFTLIISAGNVIGRKVSNGRSFGITDIFAFAPTLMLLKPAIDGSSKVIDEIMDLSDLEKLELRQHIETLEVPNDMVEKAMEKGLVLLVNTVDFVADFFDKDDAEDV